MQTTPIQWVAPSQLTGLPNNPRKIDKEGLRRLCDSIRQNGYWKHRPMAVEEQDGRLVVLDGNQRLKAARRLRLKQVPIVIYSDLTDDERNDIILRSNILNGEWEGMTLATDYATVDFDNIGLQFELPDLAATIEQQQAPSPAPSDLQDNEEQKEERTYEGIDDVLFDSNNDFEIPTLLKEHMAGRVELPITPWGANSRLRKDVATYHFYVDDDRFERLWRDPSNLILSGCKSIVEPNCSLHDQTPIAFGLQQIYKKRWLSRYMQEYFGIKIYVDLNVARKFMEYNTLGVPQGWNAFFTRGFDQNMSLVEEDYEMAQKISGLETPNFVVYGGGKKTREFCKAHDVLFITDYLTEKKQNAKSQK